MENICKRLNEILTRAGVSRNEFSQYRFAFCEKEGEIALALFENDCSKKHGYNEIKFYIVENAASENQTLTNVGGIYYEPSRYDHYTCWLTTIWITNKKYRGYGIGTFGLKFLEECASKMEKPRIEGEYRPTGLGAETMYDRNGYNFYTDYSTFVYKVVDTKDIEQNTTNYDGIKVYSPLKHWAVHLNEIQSKE